MLPPHPLRTVHDDARNGPVRQPMIGYVRPVLSRFHPQEFPDVGHTPDDRPDTTAVAVLGTGQMGLVCCQILASQGISVRLWGHDPDHVAEIVQLRESRRHLPGLILPETVEITADFAATLFEDADFVVCAVPTQFIRPVLDNFRASVPPGLGFVSVSKGVENRSLLRPTQIISEALTDREDGDLPLCCLLGPTIAAELARCLPATMVAASATDPFARQVQVAFSTSWLRVYTHSDVVGVELAGATKNVIALAAGMIDGLAAGYNAKSALLARGLAEITRLGVAMGAQPETFFGIAGVGDLATTCFSPTGRNRSCGEELGKGRKLSEILSETESVVEGVPTTESVMALARRYDVEMPITEAVHAILFEGLDPIDAISRLMSRPMREERIG